MQFPGTDIKLNYFFLKPDILLFLFRNAVLASFVLPALYCSGLFVDYWAQFSGWIAGETLYIAVLNWLVIFSLLNCINLLFRSWMLHVGVSSIAVTLIGFINRYKIEHTSTPLLPYDFGFLRNYKMLLHYLTIEMATSVGVVFAASLILFIREARRSIAPKKWQGTSWAYFFGAVTPGLVIIILICGLNLDFVVPMHNSPAKRLSTFAWNQLVGFRYNGPILSLLVNFNVMSIKPPKEYSKVLVGNLLNDLPYIERADDLRLQNYEAPDIVVVMVESLFDPTVLPGVSFSRDPMPNIRKSMMKGSGGNVVVPTFGGVTANSEFEFLTGLSVSFLPHGAVPYEHHIKSLTPSLVSVLLEQGYDTYAVHNYYPHMWRRSEVYRLFGFNRFYSLEDLGHPIMLGWRAEDVMLERKIDEVLNVPSEVPKFIFGVTLAMHGGYDHPAERNNQIEVSANVSEKAKLELSNYASALEETDKSIGRLIDIVSGRKKKTLLLLFGDHLPSFGEGSESLYTQVGFVQESNVLKQSTDDFLKTRQAPYALVANYDIDLKPNKMIGLNCLSDLIFKSANLRSSSKFWMFRRRFCSERPYLLAGRPLPEGADIQAYGVMLYDRLQGQRYSEAAGGAYEAE